MPAVSFLPLRQSNNLATRVSDSDIFGAGILTPEGVDDTIFASCAESVGELNLNYAHNERPERSSRSADAARD